MPNDVQIIEEPPQLVAATKIHTTLRRIGNDIRTGFGLVVGALEREHVSASGSP